MIKVGVLTFHFADNYGAVLQAYGLVTTLNNLGMDAKIIDYYPDHVTNGGRFKIPVSKKNIRADLVILYQYIMKVLNSIKGDGGLSHGFQKFRDHYLNVSSGRYKYLNELKQSPPDFDVYVAGSDQIWNPSEQYGTDPAYFLEFGDNSKKRVSYAASFGRDVLPSEYNSDISKLLTKLDSISIREKSGVEIIKQLTNLEAEWTPDPTFLVKDYTPIVSIPDISYPYMFSYVLRSGKGIASIQKYIAESLGLKILVPHNPLKRWKDIGETIYPSPEQWLGYIKQSEFVVTNSFHGTVFSILFNKPFITIGLFGKKGGLNERAKSLLCRLGLEDRLLTEINIESADLLMKQQIDWKCVNEKISVLRSEGISFLMSEVLGNKVSVDSV